jgi:uncharacterized protein YidB (DUF937 family)
MGLLDDMLGKAAGSAGGGLEGQLTSAISGMLSGNQGGGLSGLVEHFTKNGLGEIVSSWVGTGRNMPISPDQIVQGVGAERFNQLASATGLPVDQLKSMLAQVLPALVDRLTPEGKLPTGDLLSKGLDLLGRK